MNERMQEQGEKGAIRCLAVAFLALLVAASSVNPGCGKQSGDVDQRTFEDAGAAYDRGDFETAYRLIKPLAEQGHAKAQFNLGVMYQRGEGVPQDSAEALAWYRKAAGQDLPDAHYNLGVIYHNGDIVPRDYAEALKRFRKAADLGHAGAQYNLGSMYHKGEGVPRDYSETVKWYRKAAEQGVADAQYLLGAMYGTGRGIQQDNVLSYMWLTIAASRFSASEEEKRGMAILNGEIIASRLTPAQIAEAKRRAEEWKPMKEGK